MRLITCTGILLLSAQLISGWVLPGTLPQEYKEGEAVSIHNNEYF